MENKDREAATPKKKQKGLRILIIVICSVLALLLLLAGAGLIYINSKLSLMNRPVGTVAPPSPSELEAFQNENTDPYDPDFTGPVYEPEDVTWETLAEELIRERHDVVNVLLVGTDRSSGGRARSDSMILCTLNRTTNTLTLTSLMRDMYVQIPGYSDNRINVSYFLGGIDLLNDCIKLNFGVEMDGNFEVDFSQFTQVIDMVGGIDIELSQAEADYINKRKAYDENLGRMPDDLTEGMNHLTGAQALIYARTRDVGPADFGRTQRQRTVLTTLINKYKTMSIAQLNDLLDELLPMVTTDMDNTEILRLAAQVIPMLADLKLETKRIPADGAYQSAWISGMSVLMPDLQRARTLLEQIMGAE